MPDSAQQPCGSCTPPAGRQLSSKTILADGLWSNNSITVQILGICSALAVTNRLENALVMGLALTFVCVMSNLFISLLRRATPRRIRMIAEIAIIAVFVIVFDQFLKAFYWPMSKQLGPYVGLIITNCILMGRAEAFALQNPPLKSMLDGLANGLGYAAVLGLIGFARELVGYGSVLGRVVLPPEYYTPNQLIALAPGAFFVLGVLMAAYNAIKRPQPEEKKP